MARCATVRAMRFSLLRTLIVCQLLPACAFAANSVVNLSHYDLMRPDFGQMKREGIAAVIHECSYPRATRDDRYAERQRAAVQAGMLWGAYHYADASDPVRQADFMISTVVNAWRSSDPASRPNEVLLVLDFEKNGHYPGGTMRPEQAIAFAQRIHDRTGKYPGIYSGEYRVQQVLNSPRLTLGDKGLLTRCWLWVANYHYEPKNVAPWGRWSLWQYTGDGVCDLPRSQYPKSAGNVRKAERNVFRGGTAELQEFWREHGWRPGGADSSSE